MTLTFRHPQPSASRTSSSPRLKFQARLSGLAGQGSHSSVLAAPLPTDHLADGRAQLYASSDLGLRHRGKAAADSRLDHLQHLSPAYPMSSLLRENTEQVAYFLESHKVQREKAESEVKVKFGLGDAPT